MLICRNCNKEYTQFLKYCPSCGSELIEKKEDTPVKETGVSSITVEKEKGLTEKGLTDVSESVKNSINKKKCKNCGSVFFDDEKFCIKCGTPLYSSVTSDNDEDINASEVKHFPTVQERLQDDLSCAFHSNKFFDFFWKYAIVFALYYPIYLLMARIDALSAVVEILDYISIFGFYAYYISLVALWSKKSYWPILAALTIRFVNSFIILFRAEVPISSISRIAILIPAIVFVFKKLRITNPQQNYQDNFNTKHCPSCGASIEANDKFCLKCGRTLGG